MSTESEEERERYINTESERQGERQGNRIKLGGKSDREDMGRIEGEGCREELDQCTLYACINVKEKIFRSKLDSS